MVWHRLAKFARGARFTRVVAAAVLSCVACIAAAGDYRLDVGDLLRINVYQRPELSGEYRVQSAGEVSIPFIGAVPVAGRRTAEVAALIAATLKLAADEPARLVSVEVAEHRPFYIVGGVAAPGSYPYVNGLNVLQAIALAGGRERATSDLTRNRLDLLVALEQRTQLRHELAAALGARARLQAEQTDAETIEFPVEIAALVDELEAEDILSREDARLQSLRRAAGDAVVAFQRSRVAIEEQIRADEGRRAAKQEEAQFAEQQLSLYKDSAGVVPQPIVRELQRVVASTRAELYALFSVVASSKERLARIERELLLSQHERALQVHEELAEVAAQVAESRIALRANEALIKELRGVVVPPDADPAQQISIVRRGDGGPVELLADELTPVSPGDLIRVPEPALQTEL